VLRGENGVKSEASRVAFHRGVHAIRGRQSGVVEWRGVPSGVLHPARKSTGTPTMSVQVETDRKGHILKRHLLGCTFYSFEAGTDASR
jgi:hypothetical protein